MLKKRFVVFVILFLLLIFTVHSREEGGGLDENPPPEDGTDWGSQDWAAKPYTGVAWEDIPNQNVVPADRIDDIPADKVKVNEVKDPSKLTYNQLNYGNNYNDFPDKSKLDSVVVSRITSERARLPAQVDLGSSPVEGGTTSDGFWFSRADALTLGDTTIVNGEGITYSGGKLHIDKADSVIFGSSYATKVNDMTIDANVIDIHDADMVVADCVIADDVKTTVFTVNGGVKMEPYEEVNYPVEVSGTDIDFESPAGGMMDIYCSTPPSITLTNAVANITTGNVNERIEANNSVEFTSGAYGVECMEMSPLAIYYYTDKHNIEKDFSAKVDTYDYRLCIRKHTSQNVNGISCEQCGIVDLAEHKMKFNGVLKYRRYPFKVASNNYVLLDLTQKNVYLPENNASLFFKYDSDNRFLPAEQIMANTPPIASYVSNYLILHELATGAGTHTFAQINVDIDQTQLSQNLIESYECSYDNGKARITNNVFEEGNILILPPGHRMIRDLTE